MTNLCLLSCFSGGSDGKKPALNAEDLGLSPRLGRYSGEGNGNLLQYYCLENSMDRGAWGATVHGGHKESDTAERPAHTLWQNVLLCFAC